MTTTYSKQILNLIAITLLASISRGAITPTSDDFNSDTSGSWLDVGSTPTVISYDNNSAKDWYDGDDATYITNYSEGMEITGDGLLNDGGLHLDTQNGIVGDEAMGLTIAGAMEAGEQITFTGNLYNNNISYTDVNVQLWNLTEGVLLAESGAIPVKNYDHVSYTPVDFKLVYTATGSDAGDTLQIRFRDAGNNKARDIFVDNFEVTSSPPPAPVLYAYEGFDTAAANGTKAETVGVTGSGFLQYTNTHYLMTIHDGLSYEDANERVLDVTGKSAGMTNLLGGTQNLQLLLNNAISSTNTGVVYMSFLQQIDSANSWGMNAGLYNTVGPASGNPGTAVAAWRSTSSNFGIYGTDGIDERLGPDSTPASNLLMFVVAKLDLDTGTMTAWINPTNLARVTTSATWTMSEATASGSFIDMNLFNLSRKTGSTKIDEIRIGNTLAVVVPYSKKLYGYDAWAAGYGLSGTNAASTANPDGDLLNNLYEYGLGGNPTNPADTGYTMQSFTANEGGTNWFYVVHPQIDDSATAGLTYSLQTDDDLVTAPGWTNATYEILGTATNGFGPGFDAVTNQISTEGESQEFIHLLIERL